MNYRVVSRLLGVVAILIALTMTFSLPWAWPSLGTRLAIDLPDRAFETNGFYALIESILFCVAAGLLLIGIGGRNAGVLYHKEAMAVVGLSWVLATILGALPFWLSGTIRGPTIRVDERQKQAWVYDDSWLVRSHWQRIDRLPDTEFAAIARLTAASSQGVAESSVTPEQWTSLRRLLTNDRLEGEVEWLESGASDDENGAVVRLRWTAMTFVDAMFESQSGFSTTGATVISDLEDPRRIPHCILFWRSSTHFLGGLGIIVLFVAILGQGSAGKALMRHEVPGPRQESSEARMQHTAWVFAGIYLALTTALTVILWLCGLSWFDALCHAFGTMATGGFSTYNASVGHFNSGLIESVVIVFMVLAGTNFTLLYFLFRGPPSTLYRDVEWQTYVGIMIAVSVVVTASGLLTGDFTNAAGQPGLLAAIRYGVFQVVSIMTTTGFGTHDFDAWNHLSRCTLFLPDVCGRLRG